MTRRLFLSTLLLASFALIATPNAQKDDKNDEATRIADATTALTEIMGAGDKAIPKSILAKAEAIAVFPSLIKAGFVVGGMRGRGVLSVREGGTWSPPAFMTVTGGSFGLQIGAQATDLVLV